MELPFLKNKKNQGGGGPAVSRDPDESNDSDLMDQVMDELFSAFEKKDKALALDALRAIILHVQDEDQTQETMT